MNLEFIIDKLFDPSMIPFAPIVFVAVYIESYLLNAGGVTVLSKNPKATVAISCATNFFCKITLIIVVAITNCNVYVLIGDSLGDVLADYCVSERWPKFVWKWINSLKKKKSYLKKIPVSTA